MEREPRNGLGVAYRSLLQDTIEMWQNFNSEEKLISEAEAKHILEGIGKIKELAKSIELMANGFIKIAEARRALKMEAPPELLDNQKTQ